MPPAGAVPVGAKTIFAGKVAAIDVTDLVTVFTVNDYRDLFTISMPRHFYQGQCRHVLFDVGCNASGNMRRDSFAQLGVVGPGTAQNSIVPMSRTNFIHNSNGPSLWSKTNITVTSNAVLSPDGTNDGSLIQRTSTSGSFIENDVTIPTTTGSQAFTLSIYAKPGSGNFLGMYLSDQHGDPDAIRACFDLVNGVVSTSPSSGALTNLSASITPDANGFFRCSMTATYPAGATAMRPSVSPRSTTGQIDGSDPTSTASVFIFGMQVEATSAPTSYIQTVATSVTVPALANPGGSGTYTLGTVLMVSGQNAGFQRTIANWDGTSMKLVAAFPFTINTGDVFSAAAGCDLQLTTCGLFNNIPNFGGEPYIPAPETMT